MENLEVKIENLVDTILADYAAGREIDRMELVRRPDKTAVIDIIDKLRWIIFPGYSRDKNYKVYNAKHNLSMLIEDVFYNLNKQISLAFQGAGLSEDDANKLGARKASLDEIFRECDVISNHVANLPETQGMMRYEHFSRYLKTILLNMRI